MTALSGRRPRHLLSSSLLVRAAAPLAAVALLAGPAAQAAAPAADSAARASGSTVTIVPQDLPRGAEVRGAHPASPASRTLVRGDVRVTVPGTFVSLLGTSGSSFVVNVLRGEQWSVLRVGPGGSERLVTRSEGEGVVLGSDGRLLTVVRSEANRTTRIDVVRAATGETVQRRTFSGYKTVLDVRGTTAILGSDQGTYRWDLTRGGTTLLTRRVGYTADIAAGRLASFDGDPYLGGCSVVTSLAAPGATLWRSCGERVEAFSPDGQRVATVHILSDGAGPSRVTARGVRGRLIATYDVDGVFGALRWESGRALLLDAYGRYRTATVRCEGTSCVRASAQGFTSRG